jgi:hypothetical protein
MFPECDRYDEEFGGVVLAYFNETLLDTKAPILISLPYASVDVRATLLLFKPMVGRPLGKYQGTFGLLQGTFGLL